jgi:hypothetical protein
VKLVRPKVSAKVEAAIKERLAAGTGILKTARTVGGGATCALADRSLPPSGASATIAPSRNFGGSHTVCALRWAYYRERHSRRNGQIAESI